MHEEKFWIEKLRKLSLFMFWLTAWLVQRNLKYFGTGYFYQSLAIIYRPFQNWTERDTHKNKTIRKAIKKILEIRHESE